MRRLSKVRISFSRPRFTPVFALVLFMAIGCGYVRSPFTSQPVSPTPVALTSSAYVESATPGTVSMFEVSSSGLWTPTNPPSIAAGQLPESLIVHPSGRFVYVANARDSTVSQFAVDHATGLLTPLSPSTVVTGADPQDIAVDPSGHFVYTANTVDNTISMFTVNPVTGALLPNSPATVPGGGGLSAYLGGLVVDPLSRFVYAAKGGTVAAFSLNASTGVLTPVGEMPSGGGRGFTPAIDPAGRFLYVTSEVLNKLFIFSIDQTTGALSPAATPTVAVGDSPSAVAIDPGGRHVYVVNRNAATISQFSINSDGSLTALAKPLLFDGGQPWQMLIDPSGQLAYVSNEGTASVEIYKIDSMGQLILYGSAPAGYGAGGMGIARGK